MTGQVIINYICHSYSSSFLKIVKTKTNKFIMLNHKKSKRMSLVPHFAFNKRKSMSRSRRSCRTGPSRGSGYKRADRGGRLPIKWILFTSALKIIMMREHKTEILNKELKKESSWISWIKDVKLVMKSDTHPCFLHCPITELIKYFCH